MIVPPPPQAWGHTDTPAPPIPPALMAALIGATWPEKNLALPPQGKPPWCPPTLMAHLVFHLRLYWFSIATLMPIVDVEAALRAKTPWVGNDDTADTPAVRPCSIHHTVIVTYVSTIDAFHANCTAMSSHNHVGAWPSHDAIGTMVATGCQIAIRHWMVTGTKIFTIFRAKTNCPIFRLFWPFGVLKADWKSGITWVKNFRIHLLYLVILNFPGHKKKYCKIVSTLTLQTCSQVHLIQ